MNLEPILKDRCWNRRRNVSADWLESGETRSSV